MRSTKNIMPKDDEHDGGTTHERTEITKAAWLD